MHRRGARMRWRHRYHNRRPACAVHAGSARRMRRDTRRRVVDLFRLCLSGLGNKMRAYGFIGFAMLVSFAILMGVRSNLSDVTARAAVAAIAGGCFGFGLLMVIRSTRSKRDDTGSVRR
jgi:hypothetical protein